MKNQVAILARLGAVLLLSASALETHAAEPVRIPLWAHGAPGEPATKPEDEPVLTSDAAGGRRWRRERRSSWFRVADTDIWRWTMKASRSPRGSIRSA